jgi:hypothetical protein
MPAMIADVKLSEERYIFENEPARLYAFQSAYVTENLRRRFAPSDLT